MIDRDGEAFSMCKALHAQAPKGKWTEMTLDCVATVQQALDAVSTGCTVALHVTDMAVAESLICELSQRLQVLPTTTPRQIFLHTRCGKCCGYSARQHAT